MTYNAFQKRLNELDQKVRDHAPNPKYPDHTFVVIALQKAMAAANEANFRVRAVLARENDEVVPRGQNRAFGPHLRSDLHAEMDVTAGFEERFQEVEKMKGFVLYASLEPCPVCVGRLISSRVGKIYYAVDDEEVGMVDRSKYMLAGWVQSAKR